MIGPEETEGNAWEGNVPLYFSENADRMSKADAALLDAAWHDDSVFYGDFFETWKAKAKEAASSESDRALVETVIVSISKGARFGEPRCRQFVDHFAT